MKTRQIRKMLCEALDRAANGKLAADDAKSVIGLANQISASLATEVKVATLKIRLGQAANTIGDLNVAE